MDKQSKSMTLQTSPPVQLFRGDCLDVMRREPLGRIDAVVCDPPYGIGYQSKRGQQRRERIINDDRPFIWWLWDAVRLLGDAGALVCFCRWDVQEDFRRAIELAGLTVRSQWVWDRRMHGMGDCRRTLAPRHDVMWFATRPGFAFSSGRPTSVLAVTSVAGTKRSHPTEKPAELMRRIVRDVTPRGGTVLDPCMGSGATGECVRDGFGFVGVEIDANYYAAAVARLRRAIREGKKARRQRATE